MSIKEIITENYKKFFKSPWPYIAGGILLGILNIAHTIVTGGFPWSVSGAFGNWGAWIYQVFGGHPENWDYFIEIGRSLSLFKPWEHSGTVRNIGVIVGAFLAALIGSQFKLKKIKSLKQVGGAIAGGFLMGYGARLAFGCNIGSMFSAVPSLSLHGYVFSIFLFSGAMIGSKILKKYLI
jgi:uncharacterized protein